MRIASGTATTHEHEPVDVEFPAGRFDRPPIVVATADDPGVVASIVRVTSSGCAIVLHTGSASSLNWAAYQH